MTGIDRVQPTLFAMQVALAATMKSYGVRPGAVIGHSLGEVAAAVVAGALSLEDGVRVICRRSRLMSRIAGAGAMASVELPAQQVRSELAARGVNDVVVAVVASPQSTVIGGATETVRELVAAWEQRDVMAREVAVDVASHSPQVDPILDELADVLADLDPDDAGGSVLLGDPVRPARAAGVRCRLLGGQPAPHGAVRRGGAGGAGGRLPGLRRAVAAPAADPRRRADRPQPRHAGRRAGRHAARAGAAARAARLPGRSAQRGRRGGLLRALSRWAAGGRAAADLDAPSAAARAATARNPQAHGGCTVAVHPLLGAHVRLQEEPERHVWQAEVGTAALPWLGDHQIHDVAALPGAAYCEMALAAARAVLGEASEVRDIRFEQMLLLDEQTPVGAVGVGAMRRVSSTSPWRPTRRASKRGGQRGPARRRAMSSRRAHDIAALLAAHPRRVDGAELRQRFDERGVQFGPAFTGLAAVHTGEGAAGTVLAEVGLPAPIRSQQAAYGVHPALLDACFQSVAAHPEVQALGDGGLLLPLGVRRLRAYGAARNARYCYTRVTTADAAGVEADLDVLDEHGTVLLTVQGLRMGTGVSEQRPATIGCWTSGC